MSIELLFYTQIGSILLFIISLFVLYRLLVEQKDATIQFLEKQLQAFKDDPSDIMLTKLSERVRIASDEVERLAKDKETLTGVNEEAAAYIKSLEDAREADKALIQKLETYRNNIQPQLSFLSEIVLYLDRKGQRLRIRKNKDGAVEDVVIEPEPQ